MCACYNWLRISCQAALSTPVIDSEIMVWKQKNNFLQMAKEKRQTGMPNNLYEVLAEKKEFIKTNGT